ncbi:MAG: DUF2784 domain-containing protein [Gemmatimonadota bacterium]|jgi:hypothetical protein
MLYRTLADGLVLFHVAFVLFVALGGLLVLRWRRLAWVHLPCAIWGALVEFGGWICPVTPLEVHLRVLGGEAGYSGGFIENYILPLLYPVELTRALQIGLGTLVVAANLLAYGLVMRERGRRVGKGEAPGDADPTETDGGG